MPVLEPDAMTSHAVIVNVFAVATAPRKRRVLAVEWAEHDIASCDGNHLEIATDGWFRCPVAGCRWQFDPGSKCPVHGVLQ